MILPPTMDLISLTSHNPVILLSKAEEDLNKLITLYCPVLSFTAFSLLSFPSQSQVIFNETGFLEPLPYL